MTIRRQSIETVPILLKRVENLINRATGGSNQTDTNSPLVNSLQKIEDELIRKTDLFPHFESYGETLVKAFNSLEQEIIVIDDLFDDLDRKDNINDRLESIVDVTLKKIENLASHVKQLPLEDKESKQSKQDPDLPEAKAREPSTKWLEYKVEENILPSPAMAILQVSYDVLNSQLKICFLSFAIFPEKAEIKKRQLIYWWIGEGLITKSKDETAQEVGEGIFMELIEKGLIQPCYKGNKKKSPIVDSCTMHSWIRRMLISVAAKGEFFDFDLSGEIVHDYSNSKSRRACLVLGNKALSGNNESRAEELFTIFNVNEQYLSFKADLFLKIRKLVILQLGRWQKSAKHHIEVENVEFLAKLGALKHLKYLSLQGISRITALPDSILQCTNLEILDLKACHNIERLPDDISSLRKLTHLDISECYLLESLPKGIEKLSSLQVLKGLVMGHSRKNPCKLSDLAKLKKLRKLSIQIGSEVQQVELNELQKIETLRVLTISWRGAAKQSKLDESRETNRADELKILFPPKLEKLDLWCLPHRSPGWLKPSNLKILKRLYIRGGELESLVSDPNNKWKVQILRLKYLQNMKSEASHLQDNFPDLSYFERIRRHRDDEGPSDEDVEWRKEEGWEVLKQTLSN